MPNSENTLCTSANTVDINGPFSKKLSNNGKDILRKNNSDFANLNVMYAHRILCQASVCNIQQHVIS